ncbi:MAG: (Fe-S)-binding protein [Nanoarchaeota archaeon]
MNIFSKKKEKTLYFPGCTLSTLLPHLDSNWQHILKDLGIDYITLPNLGCCGSPAYNAGYFSDFEDLKAYNLTILKKNNITEIISPSPHCVAIFKEKYGFLAKHTTEVLFEKRDLIKPGRSTIVAYHDSCILARKLGLTTEPRELLKKTGITIKEFPFNKEQTICCGASGGLSQNNQPLANALAKKRAEETPEQQILVACPVCYYHLKKNTNKNIKELSEAFIT